jgi:hypothetical protein
MNTSFLLKTCLALCATAGYSNQSEDQIVPQKETPISETNLMLGKLTTIINNYQGNPETELSKKDIADLTTYASNSLEKQYESLSQSERSSLSQIINLNSEKLNEKVLTKFNTDQKLGARMSTQDIETLKNIVVDIRNGKSLTPRQVSDVKDFKVMISKNAYAFIPELSLITQYVSLNQGQFSKTDLETFRQASRDASGLTAEDIRSLYEIARRNTTNLNREDLDVLRSLALKAPLGTLNSLDPQTAFILAGFNFLTHRLVF